MRAWPGLRIGQRDRGRMTWPRPKARHQCLRDSCLHPQIAMFVVPVVCLVGWGYGHPFSLDMPPLLIVVLALAVLQTCGPRVQTLQLCEPSP